MTQSGIRRIIHEYIGLFPLISIFFTALCFFRSELNAFIFVSLVPYIYYLQHAVKCKVKHRIILTTWLSGFIYCVLVTSWLLKTKSLALSDVGGSGFYIFALLTWLFCCLYLSSGFLLLGMILNFLKKNRPKWVVISLVLLWPLCEIIRSLIFTILSYGKGASIGVNFNFGVLALGSSGTPVIYAARLVGFFGLSGLIVAINIGVFYILKGYYRKAAIIFVIIMILIAGGWLIYKEPKHSQIKAISMQLSSKDASNQPFIDDQFKQLPGGADIAVLPEYNLTFDYQDSHAAELANHLLNDRGLIVYSRKIENKDGETENQLVHKNRQLEIISQQSKSYLIPMGEYLPWLAKTILTASNHQAAVKTYRESLLIHKSPVPEHSVSNDGLKVASVACSGLIVPSLYTPMVRQGSQIITNSASLDEFRKSSSFQSQAKQYAIMQAVIHNRPFVQSSQSSYGLAIESDGKVIYEGPAGVSGMKQVSLNVTKRTTLYDYIGELFLFIGVMGGLIVYRYTKP